MGKYVLKQGSGGQFMFNLLAANGQVILTSEQYTTKSAAEKGIASVQACSKEDSLFDRKMSKRDQPFFNLKAKNGQVIGQSQMYSSASARDNGIESVKTNGPSSEVDDQT